MHTKNIQKHQQIYIYMLPRGRYVCTLLVYTITIFIGELILFIVSVCVFLRAIGEIWGLQYFFLPVAVSTFI